MRSFIQHREALLVNADVARHDSAVGRDQEHSEAYSGPSLPRLARVCLDTYTRKRSYLRSAVDKVNCRRLDQSWRSELTESGDLKNLGKVGALHEVPSQTMPRGSEPN